MQSVHFSKDYGLIYKCQNDHFLSKISRSIPLYNIYTQVDFYIATYVQIEIYIPLNPVGFL